MKIITILGLAVCCIVMASQSVYAQDFKADIKEMYASMERTNAFYTEMTTKVYEDGAGNKPSQVINAFVKRLGKNYLTGWNGNRYLVNENYVVLVSEEMETIVVQSLDSKSPPPKMNQISNIDSLIKRYKDPVQFKGIVNGQKHYVITPKSNGVTKIELFIDEETRCMKKLTYWFNDGFMDKDGRVETVLSNTNLNPSFSQAAFSEQQFFYFKGKEMKPMEKYKNFDVVDTADESDF